MALKHKEKKRAHKDKIIAGALLLAPVVASALYNGLTVRHYTLFTGNLGPGWALRLVLLTDLHSYIYGQDQQPLIDKIKEQEPDLILMAGDIADGRKHLLGSCLLLEGIQDIAPIYYATGNHEYWSWRWEEIQQKFQSYQVNVLSDHWERVKVKDTDIIVAGLNDPDKARCQKGGYDPARAMERAFSHLGDEPGYKILLAHRPERWVEYSRYPFDLVLSGHAHGGQVRIPHILNGLYAPQQGLFPRYAGGLYRHGNMTHIVGRGLTRSRFPRVWNPPELVVVDLVSE